MEILDLESCDFIQYKPEVITWPKPVEFMVTHVVRDRGWFQEMLPIMDAFWKRVLWHRVNGVEGLVKVPRVCNRRKKVVDMRCQIEDDPYDIERSEDVIVSEN